MYSRGPNSHLKPWLLGFLIFASFVAIPCNWLLSVGKCWHFVGSARDGDIRTVRAMLDAGMPPDEISQIGGVRAISMAAYSGHVEIVRLLLDHGANPTYGLPQAILMNRTDIVHLLVTRGADVQHWQAYSTTPLQFAKKYGNTKIITLMQSASKK